MDVGPGRALTTTNHFVCQDRGRWSNLGMFCGISTKGAFSVCIHTFKSVRRQYTLPSLHVRQVVKAKGAQHLEKGESAVEVHNHDAFCLSSRLNIGP